MDKLLFATNNPHKLSEARAILGFTVLSLAELGITEDIPETQPTIEGNALQKARYIHLRTGDNCFADDTGLEVMSLGGEPGVRSARYAGEEHDSEANIALLLKNLGGHRNRRARFRTVVALILNEQEYLFEGTIEGYITESRSGDGGFGYDSIFVPVGYTKTFAELTSDIKNTVSHRAIAMRRLAEFLNSIE